VITLYCFFRLNLSLFSMKCYLLTLFFAILLPMLVRAQIMPAEGSTLNYRLVGLELPPAPHKASYKIEIAACNCHTEDSFKKNIIERLTRKKNKIIVEVPSFGAPYTWRYSYGGRRNLYQSNLYHFSTTADMVVDTNNTRLRIMQPARQYKDDYVFLDGNEALYDMNGKPVWYLPNLHGLGYIDNLVTDLKLSPHNTITYLLEPPPYNADKNVYKACEVNYDGTVLWKAPDNGAVSGDSIEYYHHQFSRLANGHYMVLGSEFKWQYPYADSSDMNANAGKKGYARVQFGTLIEYDEKGNVVWSWKSSDYFLEHDTSFITPPKRFCPVFDYVFMHCYDFTRPEASRMQQDVHENAFFFDEKNQVIYVSFKNISRVLKLKYPEGTVLNSYGPAPQPGGKETGDTLFCYQHGCGISEDGYLYLFNNNLCGTTPAKVEIMKEPDDNKGRLKKIWEYQCTVEDGYPQKFFSGGDVMQLPGGAMYISMGSDYSKVLIVSHDKKVLWSAIPERWNAALKKWVILHQARSSIITRQQLEALIWNSEAKKLPENNGKENNYVKKK